MVATFLQRAEIDAIRREAVDELMEIAMDIATSMIDSKGLVFGDIDLSRRERILQFNDAQLQEPEGLQRLRMLAPDLYEQRVRQQERDLADEDLL